MIMGIVKTSKYAGLAEPADQPQNEVVILEKELKSLRAKVASSEVLVEALRGLVDDLKLRATFGQEDAQGVVACGSTVWRRATEALATYDKISEVKHDTK